MSKTAVFFPGIGYHCDKPLLYYSRCIANKLGYETSGKVNYVYKAGNIRGNAEKMREAYEVLFSQAEEQLAGMIWREYQDILFVSKSIGTIIAASYAEKYGLQQVRHVLYTPLVQTYSFAPDRAVAFIGTEDPWSSTEEIVRLSQEKHIPLTIYEGCNHSLECPDILKNIENLKDVMQRTMRFCMET